MEREVERQKRGDEDCMNSFHLDIVHSVTLLMDTVHLDTLQMDTLQSDTAQSDTVRSDTIRSDTVKSQYTGCPENRPKYFVGR